MIRNDLLLCIVNKSQRCREIRATRCITTPTMWYTKMDAAEFNQQATVVDRLLTTLATLTYGGHRKFSKSRVLGNAPLFRRYLNFLKTRCKNTIEGSLSAKNQLEPAAISIQYRLMIDRPTYIQTHALGYTALA